MRSRKRQTVRGHLLLAILIAATVSAILLGAAVPTWQSIVRRDKEDELIFRGESYVEAIRLFQKKNGRLPVNLEELHKRPNNFIRKLYKDPMTRVSCDCPDDKMVEGDFAVIFAGPNGQPILPGQQTSPGGTASPTSPGETQGAPTPSPSAFPAPTPSPTPSATSMFGSGFGAPVAAGPIIGVYSKCEEESIKVYDGMDHYNEWFFVMKPQQPQRGPGTQPPPGGGTPPPGGGTPPPGGGFPPR